MARGRRETEAYAHIGGSQNVTFDEIGKETDIQKAVNMVKAEAEAFMNEKVTVMVLSTNNNDEDEMVHVGVNGVTQFFRRNVPQDVKRKFVARLARSRATDYRQNLEARMGEGMNQMTQHHSLRYPFTVIRDTERGHDWLKNVLASAA